MDEKAVERAAAEAKSKADAEWTKKLEAAQKAEEKSKKNAQVLLTNEAESCKIKQMSKKEQAQCSKDLFPIISLIKSC